MPVVNLSNKGFSLLIGAVDVSKYLLGLTVSTGYSEMSSPVIWTGSFTLAYTPNYGLSESAFSELSTPGQWRRGQQTVTLSIQGYTALKLRIDNYHYNPSTRIAQGKLTQVLDLLAFDRPAEEIDTVKVGGKTPLNTVVTKLLEASGAASYSISGLTGDLDVQLVTKDPIDDAQRLCAINWNWLYVDNTEQIRTKLRPETGAPLFIRSLGQVDEFEYDTDNINFAAEKVIVTGSRQNAVPPKTKDPDPDDDSVDDKGRPKKVVTNTVKSKVEVYGDDAAGDTALVLAQVKTIEYTYSFPDPDTGKSELIQTVTTYQKTLGEIFKDLYPANTALIVAEIQTETKTVKTVQKTLGELDPDNYPGNTALITASREEVITGYYPDPYVLSTKTDPKTGKALQLERQPEPEDPQIAPDFELETQVFKGEFQLNPVGWSQFLPKTFPLNVGFLPSQAHANKLARAIGIREVQRRDAVNVTMPVPVEWLAAGCPIFPICAVHDGMFVADNLVLAIAEGQVTFAFTGDRIGTISAIPDPPDPVPVIASGLHIGPSAGIVGTVGLAINSVQLAAYGGTPAYSFSGTLPAGLSISSGGLISGTPTATASGNYTITVTDSLAATATRSVNIQIVAAATPTLPYSPVLPSVGTLTLTTVHSRDSGLNSSNLTLTTTHSRT